MAEQIDTPRQALWAGWGKALRADYRVLLQKLSEASSNSIIVIAEDGGRPGSTAWIITSEAEFNKYRNGGSKVVIIVDYNRPG